MRSYTDGGEHYDGQIGAEPTPQEYIDNLIDCTREWMRVLKPTGSIFVDLGDKYASGDGSGNQNGLDGGEPATRRRGHNRGARRFGVPKKSLLLLPERYRIACVDELGLIARAVICWSKINGLPESVTDRVRRSHEDWVHLTLQPHYYSAIDHIRQPHAWKRQINPDWSAARKSRGLAVEGKPDKNDSFNSLNPLGALPGSVWEIREGDSLIRSVLESVAAGGITIDEGERLLAWTGATNSGPRWSRPTVVGNGQASSTGRATDDTGKPASATDEHIASPTNSSKALSPTGSPSTTSAETGAASTLTTSSPSLSQSTFSGGQDLSQPASTATNSRRTTHTSAAVDTESAESASVNELGPTDCGYELAETVWTVPTEPFSAPPELGISHYAAFPCELPRRIILGWSPSGICTTCGEGRRPVVDKVRHMKVNGKHRGPGGATEHLAWGVPGQFGSDGRTDVTLTGEVCACTPYTDHDDDTALGPRREYHFNQWTPAPTRPALILDPFAGTGTSLVVAKALGRDAVGVDMSADYCRLATWRVNDPAQIAKAMGVPKPPKQLEGQTDLLTELDGDAA